MEHLTQVQDTAKRRVDDIVNKLKIEYRLTEEMKQHNQMEWVGQMNSIKNQAEEIVLNELIYI